MSVLNRYEVIVFYQINSLTEFVFHEVIPIGCENRVNAKKYAEKDFNDIANDYCPNLEITILKILIKESITINEIIEIEKQLELEQIQKDRDNLEFLIEFLMPKAAKIVRNFLNDYEIDRFSLLPKYQKEILELSKIKGIGDATMKVLKTGCNGEFPSNIPLHLRGRI